MLHANELWKGECRPEFARARSEFRRERSASGRTWRTRMCDIRATHGAVAEQAALAMDGLSLNDTAITILNNIMEKPQSVPSGTDPGGKRNAKNGLHNPC